MGAETPQGHRDGTLLAALKAGPRHGYAVKEALRSGSGGHFDLPAGTWDDSGGQRRRVCQLTPAGQRITDTERGSCRHFAAAVTALLESGAPRPAAAP